MRFSVLLLALITGCSVGEVQLGGGGGGPDGGGGGGGDGSNSAAACANRGAINAAHVHTTGGTQAGNNCMDGVACHGAGSPNGAFTAAGTVYKADLTTPNPGAVVRIRSGAQTFSAVADDAGNFVFGQTIAFPAETDVSACPLTVPMVTPLGPGDGACSRAGCHVAGATGRIHFE